MTAARGRDLALAALAYGVAAPFLAAFALILAPLMVLVALLPDSGEGGHA